MIFRDSDDRKEKPLGDRNVQSKFTERQRKRTDLCHSWLSVFDPCGSVMTAEEGSEVNRFACKRLELDLT